MDKKEVIHMENLQDIKQKMFEATKPKKGKSGKAYRYDKMISDSIGFA
jgi:hypothetical protein